MDIASQIDKYSLAVRGQVAAHRAREVVASEIGVKGVYLGIGDLQTFSGAPHRKDRAWVLTRSSEEVV